MSPTNIASAQPVRIVLTGFMGSGKTTIGRIVAQRLVWQFADLDDEVAIQEGLSVPDIFRDRGEASFRESESSALQRLLKQSELVIALGGGALETEANRELLAATARLAVIHLHAPFDILYGRCAAQALDPKSIGRPLLGSRGAAEARYLRRYEQYTEAAHIRADAALPPPAVVDAIIAAIGLNL